MGRVEERRWVWAGEGVSGLLTTGWLASLRSSTRCRPPVSRPRGWAGWRPSCPGQEEARQRGPGSGRGSPTVKACCGHLLPLSFSLSWDSHGRAWKIIISLKKKNYHQLREDKRGPSLVAQMVKNLPAMREIWVRYMCWEDPLEKGIATHSSILAWRIPGTEEPGGLQSMGLQRVRDNWVPKTFFSLSGGWGRSGGRKRRDRDREGRKGMR